MRRLARILLNAATVLSLVICAAILALWIQSGRGILIGDASRQLANGVAVTHERGFFSQRGEVGWVSNGFRERADNTPYGDVTFDRRGLIVHPALTVGPARDGDDFWIENGFGIGHVSYNWTIEDTRSYLMVPHWFVLLLAGALPAIRMIRRLTRWVARLLDAPDGRCPTCGYDLRATPDRCPECGAIPT